MGSVGPAEETGLPTIAARGKMQCNPIPQPQTLPWFLPLPTLHLCMQREGRNPSCEGTPDLHRNHPITIPHPHPPSMTPKRLADAIVQGPLPQGPSPLPPSPEIVPLLARWLTLPRARPRTRQDRHSGRWRRSCFMGEGTTRRESRGRKVPIRPSELPGLVLFRRVPWSDEERWKGPVDSAPLMDGAWREHRELLVISP